MIPEVPFLKRIVDAFKRPLIRQLMWWFIRPTKTDDNILTQHKDYQIKDKPDEKNVQPDIKPEQTSQWSGEGVPIVEDPGADTLNIIKFEMNK